MKNLLPHLFFLGFSLFAVNASANQIETFAERLLRVEVNQAMEDFQALDTSERESFLLEQANDNLVLAQWFLAQHYFEQSDLDQASVWFYTAVVGTMMDQKVCQIRERHQMHETLMAFFSSLSHAARNHPEGRYNAIQRAVFFHRVRREGSQQPEWVCQAYMLLFPETRRMGTLSYERRAAQRSQALDDFERASGMRFETAPDLFLIEPVQR